MDVEGKLDPSSPYYLSSGDQPGNVITHVVLKGDNYVVRARVLTPEVYLPFFDEAKKLWDFLKRNFCLASGLRIQKLRADITDSKQHKNMSIDDYYNLLMDLWDDLDRLKPLHACVCGLCTCNVSGKFAVDRDEEKLHKFYIGIDDDLYATVRTNLLSQNHLP
ncbi:Glycine--tRNA ligase beta subunit, partial [Bienertia sinuspersici]